jgi:hypothetical protein
MIDWIGDHYMRKISRKGIVKKLDSLVSKIVIARDKKCIICGSTNKLGCGHLFSRIAYSTRWDLDNCYASCWACNFRHEYDPYPMQMACKNLWGERHLGMCNPPLTIKDLENWLFELHYRYVHPVKYKTYELAELYERLNKVFESLVR